MSNKLTPAQIEATAAAAGYEPRAVRAVIKVETGGSGYDAKTGYLLIQFEPAWFRRQLPKADLLRIEAARLSLKRDRELNEAYKQAIKADPEKEKTLPKPEPATTIAQVQLLADWETTQANLVEGQVRERTAFDAACRINKHVALLSTSWGLPQMMGFNHKVCGYNTVEEMVEAFRVSEANQVAAMLKFISANPKMKQAMKLKDWAVLAYYYNGAGYKQFNYDRRLAAAYASLA